MSYSTPDVYCQPDKFELSPIGELDEPDLDYEFSMLCVWQHADGRLFYATDHGCSCPSPFEMHTSLDDLDEITSESYNDFCNTVQSFGLSFGTHHEYEIPAERRHPEFKASKVELMSKVHRILHERKRNGSTS